MAEEYEPGTSVTVVGTFRNEDEVLADPTTVVVTVKAPDGTTSTPTPTNPSTGVYRAAVALTTAGTWRVKFAGTGTVARTRTIPLLCRSLFD
jgi:hypothetical protein